MEEAAVSDATIHPALDYLRENGWSVSIHTDYYIHGKRLTSWLFTKLGRCARGDGHTDECALELALEEAKKSDAREELVYAAASRITQLEKALEPFAEAAEEVDRSDDGWDSRSRRKNSWFFDDDTIRNASRVLRKR